MSADAAVNKDLFVRNMFASVPDNDTELLRWYFGLRDKWPHSVHYINNKEVKDVVYDEDADRVIVIFADDSKASMNTARFGSILREICKEGPSGYFKFSD